MNKSQKGSITVETAIVFSIVIVLVASLLSVMNVYSTNINMQRALKSTVKDLSSYSPLSIVPSDMYFTVSSFLPEEKQEEFEENISGINGSLNQLFNLDTFTSDAIDITFSNRFAEVVLSKFYELNGNSSIFAPDDIAVDFEIDINKRLVFVYLYYSVDTIVGSIDKEITDVIILWGDFENIYSKNEVITENDDDFWSLGNFQRGEYLRQSFHSNLPPTFPVINGISNGEAFSVTSINLNSTWNNSESRVRRRLEEEFENLDNFNGAEVTISGTRYEVSEGDFDVRVLIVVIPENAPSNLRDICYQFQSEMTNSNTKIEIIEMGTS